MRSVLIALSALTLATAAVPLAADAHARVFTSAHFCHMHPHARGCHFVRGHGPIRPLGHGPR